MSKKTHAIKGYTLVLNKILFITPLFKAENNEGIQFNISLGDGIRIRAKYPTREEATLARELLVRAIEDTSS